MHKRIGDDIRQESEPGRPSMIDQISMGVVTQNHAFSSQEPSHSAPRLKLQDLQVNMTRYIPSSELSVHKDLSVRVVVGKSRAACLY